MITEPRLCAVIFQRPWSEKVLVVLLVLLAFRICAGDLLTPRGCRDMRDDVNSEGGASALWTRALLGLTLVRGKIN